jgi:hypothetical protein
MKEISLLYCVQVNNIYSGWQQLQCYSILQNAIDDLEKQRRFYPKLEFRLIRSEWAVIG